MNWLAISITVVVVVTVAVGVLLWSKWKKRFLTQLKQEKHQRQQTENRLLAQLEQEKHQRQEARKLKDLSQEQLSLQKIPKLTTTLHDLLVSERWKEADHETLRIMLNVTNREQEGWLNVASIHNFPREDLRSIDQLWVEYSNGRFGFSVQQRIWKSVGGNLKANDKIYEAFGDCVEWRVHKNWLQINELTFNSSAPTGHLPGVAVRLGGLSWGVDGFWWDKREAYVFLLSQKDW